MKKHIIAHKRIWACLLAVAITTCTVLAGVYLKPIISDAFYDKDQAITFGEFNSKTPVTERFFFVGTYVFSLDAISDEIYEKAIASQSDMNQFNEYYKSELAGGVWYDISGATDLSNITTNGTKVDQATLNKLYVTVYIDANGNTYNAKTMASTTIYNNPYPYDLTQIPELKTLHSQYEAMFSENSTGVNLYYYETLKSFFATDFREQDSALKEETQRLDEILYNLQITYTKMMEADRNEEAEEVQKIMKRVDNARRALIYKKLAIGGDNGNEDYELNKLLMLLSNMSENGVSNIEDKEKIEQSTMPYDAWTNSKGQYTYDQLYEYIRNHDGLYKASDDVNVVPEFDKYFEDTSYKGATATKQEFQQNDTIISTLYDADSDCKKAYDKYTSESSASPDSHIGKAIYNCEEALFAEAENGYTEKLSAILKELVALNNISANVVVDKNTELSKISGSLLSECEKGFTSVATGGAGANYAAAAAQGANSDGLNNALEVQADLLNQEMTELEFVITAYRMRVTPKECYAATLKWIDATDALTSKVANDAFASKAKVAINTHKAWLTTLLEQLVKEDESLQSELDKLKSQKESLNNEKMKALDENDLNAVKKIEEKLKEIDSRIDEEIAKLQRSSDGKSETASAKAAAEVALAGTSAGAAQSIKKDALKKLQNGEDASEEIAALEALGAKDALAEIKEAGGKVDSDKGSGSGSDNSGQGVISEASKSIADLSEDELRNLIADILGKPFEELSPSGKVVAAVALEWAGDVGNTKAKALAKNFIEICAGESNPYVYETYTSGGVTFVKLNAIGNVTDYRYVYNNSGKEGTLAKGVHSYSFTKDSSKMKIDSTYADSNMDYAATLRYGTLYISENTAKEYFALTAQPIKTAQYSAVMDNKMKKQAEELLEIFKNGGK